MSTTDATPLGVVDWIIFVAMLVVSVSIGIYYSLAEGGQKSTAMYLVGNRQMSFIPIALSYFVSFISTVSIMGLSGEIYSNGLQYGIIIFGYIWGYALVAWLFIPFIRQFNFISVYEYMGYRFHMSVRMFAAFVQLLMSCTAIALTVLGPAIALEALQGFAIWKSILIIGPVCTFYTSVGGIKAVVWADAMQFFIMIGSITAVAIIGTNEAGGITHVWNYAGEHGRLDVDFRVDPTVRVTFLSMIISGGFTVIADIAKQGSVQRFLSAKSTKTAQRSVMMQLPLKWIFFSMIYLTGLILFAFYNNTWTGLSPAINTTFPPGLLIGRNGGEQRYEPDYSTTDQILVYFVSSQFGHITGFQGLFVSGLFSATLSSVSTALSAIVAVITRDILPSVRLLKFKITGVKVKEDDARDTKIAKIVSLFFGMFATVLSLAFPYLGTLVEIGPKITGSFSGPLTGLLILGMCFHRTNSWGAFLGLLAGSSYGIFIGVGSTIYREAGMDPLPMFTVSLYLNQTVNLLITVVVGILVSEFVRLISPWHRKQRVNPNLLIKYMRPKQE